MTEIEKAIILLGNMLDTEKNNLRYARTEDTKNYHNNNIESLNLAIKALEKEVNKKKTCNTCLFGNPPGCDFGWAYVCGGQKWMPKEEE